MCASHAAGVVEGVSDLAFGAMCGQVKLGNEVGEGEICQIDVFVMGFEASVEVD